MRRQPVKIHGNYVSVFRRVRLPLTHNMCSDLMQFEASEDKWLCQLTFRWLWRYHSFFSNNLGYHDSNGWWYRLLCILWRRLGSSYVHILNLLSTLRMDLRDSLVLRTYFTPSYWYLLVFLSEVAKEYAKWNGRGRKNPCMLGAVH